MKGITLYDVCSVPWGVFSTMGGYLEHRGDVQYHGGCSVPWGIHVWDVQYHGGYLEHRGDVQYHGGYMMCGMFSTMGDILSTMGGTKYRGGYHLSLF